MRKLATIGFMVAMSLFANFLSLLFGWVWGFLGVVGFNLILVLIPGMLMTYKATRRWPGSRFLWPASLGAVPVILGVFYLLYQEIQMGLSTMLMGMLIVISCHFTSVLAIDNKAVS